MKNQLLPHQCIFFSENRLIECKKSYFIGSGLSDRSKHGMNDILYLLCITFIHPFFIKSTRILFLFRDKFQKEPHPLTKDTYEIKKKVWSVDTNEDYSSFNGNDVSQQQQILFI
jgi:hypothetical protein